MKPISFSKITRGTGLDTRGDLLTILEAKRIELSTALANSKPFNIDRTNSLLRETREERAAQSAHVGALYAAHRELHPGQPTTEEIRAAEAILSELDASVGKLRAQLVHERERWAPELFRIIDNHTKATIPALEDCLAVLDAVAALHAETDAHTVGLETWATPKSRVFADIATRLRRLIDHRKM